MKKIKLPLILGVMLILLLQCSDDSSQWILKIDGKTTTQNDFNAAYEGFIMMQASSQGLTLDEFKERVKNPGEEVNLSGLLMLRKKNFFESYKTLLLSYYEAKKTGFLNDKKTAKILKFLNIYFTANLFLEKSVPLESLKVDRAEALAEWEKIRTTNPNYARAPLEEGVKFVSGRLALMKKQQALAEQSKLLVQKYRIESNEKIKIVDDILPEDTMNKLEKEMRSKSQAQ